MAVFLSPGVFPNEIDLSVLPTGVGPLRPAFIGTAQKGPINEPTFISNSQQFIDTFGNPIVESPMGYAVMAYMEEGNQAYILRVGVECEEGQVDELADICIDTSGNREEGWARIPIFTGIDFGRIRLRDASTTDPIEFHEASVADLSYSDVDVSATDGPTSASLSLSGTYTGSIDDSFIILITGDPSLSSGSTVDGATYEIIRNSDGAVISSGVLAESGTPGETVPFDVGSGDDDSGLDAVITVTGTSPLEENDTFTFTAAPDNLSFTIEVEGVETAGSFSDGDSYTDNDDFADAFNTIVGASADVIAISSGGELILRTKTAGDRIQVTGTEAWALELGISKWTWDIPRSYLMSTDAGPYLISTSNNRVNILVIGDTTTELETSVPVGSGVTSATIASTLDLGGISAGEVFYDSFELTVSDGVTQVVVVTSDDHMLDVLKMQADFSHIRTLRFAEELGITVLSRNPRGFSDSRLVLPEAGAVTASVPLSCETDPASDECAADVAYFADIVGWLIAKSPGTWLDGWYVTLQIFGEDATRFTIRLFDDQNTEVDRVDDISFDPREERYIGNVVNEGSPLGGQNGNSFYQWEARPSFLGSDPDSSDFELRTPRPFNRKNFDGGANGIPTSAEFSSELDRAIIGNPADTTGLFSLENPETFDFNLLLIPGNSSGSVIGQALQFAEGRGDVLFLVDPPFGLRPQQVVDWHNGMLLSDLTSAINSSYGALYWSWLKIFDQFNGGEIFIPPSGHVASVFSRTARVAEQWFAPAGLNRGRLLTALDVEFNPTMGERDLLYGSGNAVNPIVNFAQEGVTVFGQRTLQRRASALDRVNVRMLLIFLKKNLIRLLRNFLFEPNDRILWAQVRTAVEPFLEDVMARRGLTAFKVVVDETNNTPERIDRNELWVSVFIKPTRAVEFVVLNLVILRTEASFTSEEVLAAGGVVTV